jgi:hypothetical protein
VVTDADFRVRAASLNLDYAPSNNVLVRVEGRLMKAHDTIFQQKAANTSDSYGNLTSSIAISF